jgi:DNA-binding transcriptional regulator GbsR (MarR family)
MKRPLSSPWADSRREFIEAGGHTTQSFGFGRILGQIYALLYLNPKPMCLDEIADELGVSKASVSTTVRQLERWAAVKRVWVKGDRKDYYEAETDFNTIIRSGLLAVLRKKLETAGGQISQVEEALTETLNKTNGEGRKELETVTKRVQKAKQFHKKIDSVLSNPLLDHLL